MSKKIKFYATSQIQSSFPSIIFLLSFLNMEIHQVLVGLQG